MVDKPLLWPGNNCCYALALHTMLCILPQAFPSCLLDTWQCLCRSSSLCHCSRIGWPLSSPCVTRRQMLSGSIPVAWFCQLPHRDNRSNTARESRQTFRAPTVFIMSEYQSVLLDMRSLEGKKRRKKKDRSLFKAHLVPSAGTAKTLGAYRYGLEKDEDTQRCR